MLLLRMRVIKLSFLLMLITIVTSLRINKLQKEWNLFKKIFKKQYPNESEEVLRLKKKLKKYYFLSFFNHLK